jgi:hypothetical protein
MTKKTTIKYISELMNAPALISAGDQNSIGGLRQSFPYFVPVRYLEAAYTHKQAPYSPAMLSAVSPYMGNWMLFSDFLSAAQNPVPEHDATKSNVSEQLSELSTTEIANNVDNEVSEVLDNTVANNADNEVTVVTENTEIKSSIREIQTPENEIAAVSTDIPDTTSLITETIPEITDSVIETNEEAIQAVVDEPASVNSIAVSEIISDIIAPATHTVESVTIPEIMETPALSIPATNELIPETETTAAPEHVQHDEIAILQPASAVTDTEEPQTYTEDFSTNLPDEAETAIATATTDIEEEHKNFWSQTEEPDNTTTVDTLTDSVPLPDLLPIKKTPAPEHTVQSQIPTEEFRPTQHSRQEKPLIYPIYTEDYFLQQGEKISPNIPADITSLKATETAEEAAKALMIMMSFSEWLLHFKSSTEKQKEETKDQRALKTMWQKEKLAAAIEEENEEIPENVFEMAVNSIAKEDGLASESLAEIYIKQGKLDKAIDMYRKLSLRNPQKNAYFARKIEEILKEKQL